VSTERFRAGKTYCQPHALAAWGISESTHAAGRPRHAPAPSPANACLDPGQVVLEHRGERGRNGGEPVLVALARTDGQWLDLNIDVLDPGPDGFHDAHAAPIEQFGHQLGGGIHQREDGGDFFAGHDHRDVDVLVGTHGIDAALNEVVEDSLAEGHYGIHRLVLSGGGDMSMYRQVGQE
jgi:hypothetical protein